MTDWSPAEQVVLVNFLAAPGHLRSALEKFIAETAKQHKASCAYSMASVPRDPERAADHAAKAQVLDEFWDLLADQLRSFEMPEEEPTLQGEGGSK